MNTEQLSKLLDSTQGHIRAFDTKAQIALGLDSLLAGLVGTQLAKGFELSNWQFGFALVTFLTLSVLSLVGVAASAIYAILAVLPQLHLQQPRSHFFFCHLVELYGRNYHAAASSLIALSEDQVSHQLATQIQANAIIADAKATRSRRALNLMTVSLILYIAAFMPFCVIAYRANAATRVRTGAPAAVEFRNGSIRGFVQTRGHANAGTDGTP